MSKSNIVLAILAGAAIGGIVAIVLKAEHALEADSEEETENSFAQISRQFSDRISTQLKTAEDRIRSVSKTSSYNIPDDEFGILL